MAAILSRPQCVLMTVILTTPEIELIATCELATGAVDVTHILTQCGLHKKADILQVLFSFRWVSSRKM